jgi:prolipoprotein diacylglyceryl transferase
LRPVLVQVGPFGVPTHDAFIALGVVAGLLVFIAEAKRRSLLDERVLWVMIGALCGGMLGAKVSALWRYLDVAPDPSVAGFLASTGRSVLGGLSGAYVGAIITKRIIGYRASTGDLFAPAVALAMAVGRWGCFLTEQPGMPTSLPWGIRVSSTVAVDIPHCAACAAGVPMHPSFLYEIAFHAAMFWLLRSWRARPRVPGALFKIYLLCYAVFRFGVEFVRGNDVVWAGLTRPQLFLLPTSLLLLAYFVRRRPWGRSLPLAAGLP